MPFKCLHKNPIICIPHFTGIVRRSCYDACALVVEHALADFLFVADQDRHALSVHGVLNAPGVVRTDGTQLGTRGVETHVQYLVSVIFHGADALPLFHVPQFDRVVCGCSCNLITTEFELRVGQFAVVPHKCAHAVTRPNIPNFGSIVKRCSQNLVTLGIETYSYHFFFVSP